MNYEITLKLKYDDSQEKLNDELIEVLRNFNWTTFEINKNE